MNISIERKVFSEAVYKVARFAERKSSTLPVLSSILIITARDGIKMRATNLEVGIDLKMEGENIADGVVAIPATILQQVASSFTNEGKIIIEHTGDTITISSGTGRSLIKTVPYDDFPSIPFPENPKNRVKDRRSAEPPGLMFFSTNLLFSCLIFSLKSSSQTILPSRNSIALFLTNSRASNPPLFAMFESSDTLII
ncbi:MAG: polymerase III subunit beta protein [Candidatus Levybacteria bacterium GW2011_GWC2_40_7]|nr:MAG: polymerase III subunit beta protein [Candidatus Levybacteria bacterium GW2011_GWC2_40_7]